MNTITLEKLKVELQSAISEHLIDAQVETWFDSFIYQAMIGVKGFIWSEQLQHVEIKYPQNWWQAFKERWFAEWMLKRWPVKYTLHVLDIKTLYPEYRPSIPNQEYRIRIFKKDYGILDAYS